MTALFFLSGIGQSAHAANYFAWDLESDMTSVGEVYSYNGNTVRSTDTTHGGAWAMKSVVTGSNKEGEGEELGVDAPWIYMPFDIVGGPPLYYRWWMKIMPGFDWGTSAGKTQASRVLSTAGIYPDVYTGYMAADGFSISGCEVLGSKHPAKGGGCDPEVAETIARVPFNMRGMDDGAWHEYIVRVKPNSRIDSRDADFQVWVDGISIGVQTGFKLHDAYPDLFTEAQGGWMTAHTFHLGSTSKAGGTMYFDDFSMDDAYNSIIGKQGSPYTFPPHSIPATPLSSTTVFANNLSRGMRNEEVKSLQQFFIQTRFLPNGYDSGYFGGFTERAVREFQYKEGIVCHGRATTTGWGNFGPITRARLNELIRTNSRVGIPTENIYNPPPVRDHNRHPH